MCAWVIFPGHHFGMENHYYSIKASSIASYIRRRSHFTFMLKRSRNTNVRCGGRITRRSVILWRRYYIAFLSWFFQFEFQFSTIRPSSRGASMTRAFDSIWNSWNRIPRICLLRSASMPVGHTHNYLNASVSISPINGPFWSIDQEHPTFVQCALVWIFLSVTVLLHCAHVAADSKRIYSVKIRRTHTRARCKHTWFSDLLKPKMQSHVHNLPLWFGFCPSHPLSQFRIERACNRFHTRDSKHRKIHRKSRKINGKQMNGIEKAGESRTAHLVFDCTITARFRATNFSFVASHRLFWLDFSVRRNGTHDHNILLRAWKPRLSPWPWRRSHTKRTLIIILPSIGQTASAGDTRKMHSTFSGGVEKCFGVLVFLCGISTTAP